jgi:hypothetical protein
MEKKMTASGDKDGKSWLTNDDSIRSNLSWIIGLFAVMLIGVLAVALETSSKAFGFGLLLSGASLLAGVIVGLLFGIPRALQYDRPPENKEERESSPSSGLGYRANTNLEQISDWLTKILVGVGLTQITKIPGKFQALGSYFGPALASPGHGEYLALSIIGFFLPCGFLFGYLWTRVLLPRALVQADLSSVITARINERLSKNEDINAYALSMVERWLDEDPKMASDVHPKDLVDSIKQASPTVKVQIFALAKRVRAESWNKPARKWLVERTIPIFKALAESAPDRFHRNYGQLGYALKDQGTPDWTEAERALSKAIEIRGPWSPQTMGWSLYEINRAICRIQQNPEYKAQRSSAQEAKTAIIQDLRVAAVYDNGRFLGESPIQDWMQLNGVTRADLIT